jgi:small subunit ribosomal protein S8e
LETFSFINGGDEDLPQWHGDLHKRKPSGGRKRAYRGKRAFEMGGDAAETVVGEKKTVKERVRGGAFKVKFLSCNTANVTDPSTGKSQKVEIIRVVKNPSNIKYQRMGVITKGAIIETPLGQAKVTSKPGQGPINAVLLQKQQV